jgi:hypothetical protein
MTAAKKILISTIILLIAGSAFIIWAVLTHCKDAAPPDISDINPPRPFIAAESNAYTFFSEAMDAYPLSREETTFVSDFMSGKTNDIAHFHELLTGCEKTLQLIEQGNLLHQCQLPKVKDFNAAIPHISNYRSIARLLSAKSRLEQQDNKLPESIATAGTLIRYGNHLQNSPESLIQYLVGVAVLGIGIERAQDLLNDSRLQEQELCAIASTLDKIDPQAPGLIRSLQCEYLFADNMISDISEGKYTLADLYYMGSSIPKYFNIRCSSGYFFQPNATRAVLADMCRAGISNAPLAQSERTSMAEILGRKRPPGGWRKFIRPNALGWILLDLIVPSYDSVQERTSRLEGLVASSRIMAACRRYATKNREYPANLDALVPAFLSVVPRDPFDGKPLRYSKSAGIIYSVGLDGLDSGGSTNMPASSSTYDRWRAEDAVFTLPPP